MGTGVWLAARRDAPAEATPLARPPARVSPSEAERIELGRRLFFEPRLSWGGKHSCASCHDPEHGFSDRDRFSEDDDGPTARHSQTLIDIDPSLPLHWDGSVKDLDEIGTRRTTAPIPTGYYGEESSRAALAQEQRLAALEQEVQLELGPQVTASGVALAAVAPEGTKPAAGDSRRPSRLPPLPITLPLPVVAVPTAGVAHEACPGAYEEAFRAVGGDRDTAPARSLSAYVRSLRSGVSAYDRQRAGEAEALSPAARRGLELFDGRAHCSQCHRLEEGKGWPTLRDGDWHDTGVSWIASKGKDLESVLRERLTAKVPGAVFVLPGLDLGRGGQVADPRLRRAFKTPTLRDVALHPPYMHDGSIQTLGEVVRHYASGCGTDPDRDARLQPGFEASDADVDDLVAFLQALTSDERPGVPARPWKERAKRTVVTLVDWDGNPISGLPVTLTAAGDLAARGLVRGAPEALVTDAEGRLAFAPGATTHTLLTLTEGLETDAPLLVPDTCRAHTFRLPVQGRARLALVMPSTVDPPATLRLFPVGLDTEAAISNGALRRTGTPIVVEGHVLPFSRRGVIDVLGGSAVLYEGWVPVRHARRVYFRLFEQKAPHDLTLRGGSTQRVDVRLD